MSGLLPFALQPHSVWSPFAAEIHAAVWDRVGLERVQELVRCWGAALKRGPLSPAWDAWETAWRGSTYPDRVIAEVMEHWGDSLEVDEEERRQLLPPSMPDRPDESTPSDLRFPLPPSHDRRSTEAKWAALAVIHDAYWLDADKINPFPEPASQQDLEACTAWVTAGGFVYRQLLEQALRLADLDLELAKSQQRVLDRWLEEVAGTVSRGTRRKATVAAQMFDLIRDSATHTWTAEQFRVKVGCNSRSTITATPAWKQLAVARGMAALQAEEQAVKRGISRKSDRRRRPKHRSKD